MSALNSLPAGIPVGEELNSLRESAIMERRRQSIQREDEQNRLLAASLNDPVRILRRPQSPDSPPQSPEYPPPDLNPLVTPFDPNDRAAPPPASSQSSCSRTPRTPRS